jgi:hypothetical protein
MDHYSHHSSPNHSANLPANLSQGWYERFAIIDKAGGPSLPKLKELSFGERWKISFNFLAYIFGPIYYAIKGMWRKGLSLLAISIAMALLLELALDALGQGLLAQFSGYAAAVIFAVKANTDYYKKTMYGDDEWW